MFDRFKEYLKVAGQGMKNPDKVAEGFMNAVLYRAGRLPKDEMDEIARRREICKNCPFMSENAKKDPLQNYKTERKDEHCSICSCPIETKTAALSADCGLTIHNAKYPDNRIELKWTKYKKPS